MTVPEQRARRLARWSRTINGVKWLVTAVGLLVTLLTVVIVRRQGGLYDARVAVVMLAPGNAYGNVLQDDPASLVDFAAVVERRLNGVSSEPRAASPDATLYGLGIRQGETVTLRNNGGQWQSNFNQPILDVEVVGPAADWVDQQLAAQLKRIQDLTTGIQQQQDVVPANRIRASVLTADYRAVYVAGNRSRASGGALLLGTLISVSLGRLVAGVVVRRRQRRAADQVPSMGTLEPAI